MGSTPRLTPGRTSVEPSVRQARSDQPSPSRKEREIKTSSGVVITTAVATPTPATKRRSPGERARRAPPPPRRSTAARRCQRADHHTTTASSKSCSTESTAAPSTSPSCVARRAISTSSVGLAGPPNKRTAPNDVNVNRKTTVAAAHNVGRSRGSTTNRSTWCGAAPRVRAAAVRSVGSTAHIAPDQPHHDSDVEEHVARGSRPAPCRATRAGAGRETLHRRRRSAA